MFKVEGRYFYGKVDYENSGTIDDIRGYGFEIRLLGGYDFKPTSSLTITPSIGFGYRYLKDDAGGRISSTGATGYSRESSYYYSPIGIEAVQIINDQWSLGIIAEYDYFWEGVQQSNLKDVDSRLNNLRNEQHSGYGLRASLVAKRRAGWGYLALEPFVRYWNIDKSAEQIIAQLGNSVVVGYEPANNTTEIGLRLLIGF
ncbi:MAG: autotransporter outer membrane beta-barrel domain-containing protein [Desulfobacterales bacterium]|nr:autotransporter outer membrane beta-barrel domain-containing protein [Desulfobacterales bacterium]